MIMNNNRFKEIVWGGITGMLLFSGIYIGLIIATAYAGSLLPASGSNIQKFFSVKKWTFEGIHTAFIITASIGVLSGVIAGWRCPQASQKLFVPAAVIGIPAILVGWFLYAYAIRVSVPYRIKLTDCTNSIINLHVKIPKGHAYHLELNTPDVHGKPDGTVTSSYKFSGEICISNNAVLISEFPISSDTAWLTASCFVLKGGELIQAQKDYDIQIILDPLPLPPSSVWLYCLQSRMDMQK